LPLDSECFKLLLVSHFYTFIVRVIGSPYLLNYEIPFMASEIKAVIFSFNSMVEYTSVMTYLERCRFLNFEMF
jgi:hypothetical protein